MTAQTKYRPLGDRVLVRVDAPETVTPGGIILPDQARKKLYRGTVIAVGDDVAERELAASPGEDPVAETDGRFEPVLKVGDVVLYVPYAGTEVPGEKDLLVMKADDVVVVVEE